MEKTIKTLSLLVLVLLFNGISSTIIAQNYSISIKVSAADTLIDYSIVSSNKSLHVAAGNVFIVEGLKPGRYRFEIKAIGYQSRNISVRVKDKNVKRNIVLSPEQFQVAFLSDDGVSVLKEELVAFGENPVAPIPPLKKGYSFKGWDKPIEVVETNITYVAKYKKNKAETILNESSVQVYPNPTRSFLNIDLNMTSLDFLVDIAIADVSGKVVYFDNTCEVKNVIDVSELSPGIYYVKVGNRSFKVLKL